MILQSLCEYYERKQDQLPSFGFEEKAIPFIIIINKQGEFIQLEENSDREDSKVVDRIVRVPKASGRSGAKSYETAYCLWDHYGYIAAQPKLAKPTDTPTAKALADAKKQHTSFKKQVNELSQALPEDEGVQAVKLFLNSAAEIEKLKADDTWQACLKKKGCNLTFRLVGETALVCQSHAVIEWVKQRPLADADVSNGFCLLTGTEGKVVRLHDAISGVNQKPAPLAAINEAAYNSYGKTKGFNFPVSAKAAFKYATALNHLLRKASPSKFRIAETSYVCWSEKKNALEELVPNFFSDTSDDPDKNSAAVKALFSSIHNGAYLGGDGRDRFFVLGLAPNSARIVIRYWRTGTIADFSEKIALWFSDIEITGQEHHGYPPLKKLLRATALQYKDDNIPANLPASVIEAVLSGWRLPETFLHATLRRIKAELGHVTHSRACIIKAYLNRKYRFSQSSQKELTVSLDKEDKRIGYRLGRLFAVLEKLQLDAQPGIKATIRDRYYSSASSTPKTVFGTLIRLSSHHLKKLEKPSYRTAVEKNIQEIMEHMTEFPSHLNLEQQGLFAIGYYHQKPALYISTKNTKNEQGE